MPVFLFIGESVESVWVSIDIVVHKSVKGYLCSPEPRTLFSFTQLFHFTSPSLSLSLPLPFRLHSALIEFSALLFITHSHQRCSTPIATSLAIRCLGYFKKDKPAQQFIQRLRGNQEP